MSEDVGKEKGSARGCFLDDYDPARVPAAPKYPAKILRRMNHGSQYDLFEDPSPALIRRCMR